MVMHQELFAGTPLFKSSTSTLYVGFVDIVMFTKPCNRVCNITANVWRYDDALKSLQELSALRAMFDVKHSHMS